MSVPEFAPVDPAFLPSPYTAALVQVLHRHPDWVRGAAVLEIGCGSGVLLATAGKLGADSLCGVDLEPVAVASARRLLAGQDTDAAVEILQGDLYAPVGGRRFDLVLANLPHFPMEPTAIGDRLPTWSSGGPDGRALLGPFVERLAEHLTADGRAVIAHNAFVGVEATRLAAQRQGLEVAIASATLLDLPPAKLAHISPAVLRRETGRSIHLYGGLAFGMMLVLVIGRDPLGGGPP